MKTFNYIVSVVETLDLIIQKKLAILVDMILDFWGRLQKCSGTTVPGLP